MRHLLLYLLLVLFCAPLFGSTGHAQSSQYEDELFRLTTENAIRLKAEELLGEAAAIALGEDPSTLSTEEHEALLERLSPAIRRSLELRTTTAHERPPLPSLRDVLRENPVVPPYLKRLLRYSGTAVASWVGLMLLLFAVGRRLSQRIARRLDMADCDIELPRALCRIYALVVKLTCWSVLTCVPMLFIYPLFLWTFIYVSFMRLFRTSDLPLIANLIAGCLLLFVFYLGVKMLQLMFSKGVVPFPSLSLERHQAPGLYNTFDQMATKLGRSAVKEVVLTPDAEFGYFVYGSLWSTLRGKDEAVMQLGAGLLDNLSLAQLECAVAWTHESFYSQDDLQGHLALRADHLNKRMTNGFIQSRYARFASPLVHMCFNPLLHVSFFYSTVLHRVSYAACYYRGLLSAQRAAEIYGAMHLRQAQEALLEQREVYTLQLQKELDEVFEEQRGLQNLYTLTLLSQEELDAVEEQTQMYLNQRLGVWETPPTLRRVFDFIGAPETTERGNVDDEPAWASFPTADKLQADLTRAFAYT